MPRHAASPRHAVRPTRRIGAGPGVARRTGSKRAVGVAVVGSLLSLATPALAHEHLVTEGESLSQLAVEYGLTVAALVEANGIADPDLILAGTTLTIPHGETPVPGGSAQPETYTVVPGDSLWSIADAYGVGIDSLRVVNELDHDVLSIGQVLRIPGASGASLPAEILGDPARMALIPVFDRWAAEYGVPADLLKSLTWFESGWNNNVVSSADAIGIGQLLPITARFVSENLLGIDLDPTIPEENIRLSARFLAYLIANTESLDLAVASYYQGLTATHQHGIYRSSQFYVDGILALRGRFR